MEIDHRTLLRETPAVASPTAPIPETATSSDESRPPRADHTPAPGEQEAITELVAESRRAIRLAGLAVATEKTCLHWVTRFSRFRMRRLGQSLREFDPAALGQYLDFLALERQVSPATQKQALNALVFLGKKVHGFEEIDLNFRPAWQGSRRPPTVLARDEIKRVLSHLEDPWKLIAELIYGGGLRQAEALKLRVKDIDFGQGAILIHDGKGGKHRVAPLPRVLEARLAAYLESARNRYQRQRHATGYRHRRIAFLVEVRATLSLSCHGG